MSEHNTTKVERKWFDSAHASLCLLGTHLRQIGFFTPLEQRVHLQQKVLKYTPVQKLEMLFVGLLAGMKAISHTDTIVRVDPALTTAFGLPGCAEQSVLADTLDAATEADVVAVQEAVADIFDRYGQAQHQDLLQDFLVRDVDLSPLPESQAGRRLRTGLHGA